MKTVLVSSMAIAIALSACSSNPSKKSVPDVSTMLRQETGQNGRACIRQSEILGFGTPKHNVVSIDGNRKYYIATVLPGCNSLDTAFAAAFKGGFGEVCGGTGKMQLRNEHCTIRDIFEFKNRDQAFATLNKVMTERKALQEQAKAEKQKAKDSR